MEFVALSLFGLGVCMLGFYVWLLLKPKNKTSL